MGKYPCKEESCDTTWDSPSKMYGHWGSAHCRKGSRLKLLEERMKRLERIESVLRSSKIRVV